MTTRLRRRAALSLAAMLLLAACATTEVTERQVYEGPQLARPDRIIVHDFVATAEDLPEGSPLEAHPASLTDEQAATARELGAAVAEELVANLQGIGLPAVRAEGQPPPAVDDIELRGYFLSIDEGSATERVVVGFGMGAADLTTAVEGFLMTPTGLRRLGGGEVHAGGGKVPGALVPLAVAARGNPLGLIVNSGVQAYGEVTGTVTIQGAAKRTADEIFEEMRPTIERQGWHQAS